jgi:Putative Flp pilus-assembly TadE/G-like
MNPLHREARREAGQVLALFTFGFLALVAAVAFVIDGGNAYANHRISQNASDAAAEAGAVVLAERLSGATITDDQVRSAVDGVLSAMEMDVVASVAEYTDIDGTGLNVTVGSLGNADPPSDAFGVAVSGDRDFGTFFAGILGMDQFTASTEATAITGYGEPDYGILLPVTPPINILTCNGQNNPAFQLPLTHWAGYELYRVPLCKNGPGNVGWIDWTPPAGGSNELKNEILNPTGSVTVPSWNFVTETGNTNSKPIEDALRTYDGTVVFIPIFDSTCNTQPTPGVTTVDACPPANVGGNGQNQWYHFQEVGAFQFCPGDASSDAQVEVDFVNACASASLSHGAYVNGNNKSQCDNGNGATSCLIGRWVNFIGSGTVTGPLGGPPSPSKGVVVQLIK